jgi:PleD family two-component response regulator
MWWARKRKKCSRCEVSTPRILIAEPSVPLANALRKFLQGWADVHVVSYVDEAVQRMRARPFEVLIAAVSEQFDGEALSPQIRKQSPETAVILVYTPSEVERAPERARAAGADGFLVGPLKRHQVLGVVQAVTRLNGLAAQVRQLQTQFDELKLAASAQTAKGKVSQAGLNAPDEAFFKKYMLLEVKRSKRYQYPVALLLISLDDLNEHLGESAPEFQRAAIRAEAMDCLSVLLRDIDVALPFGEDKYLVFLPHTPLKGSTVVAERIVLRFSKLDSFHNGHVSVGIASFEPAVSSKEPVSFGGLVREASGYLKKAQQQGGNRFCGPELPPPPKKNRVSLG